MRPFELPPILTGTAEQQLQQLREYLTRTVMTVQPETTEGIQRGPKGEKGERGPKGEKGDPGGAANFTTDETLTLSEKGVLSVNVADAVEDNTLPISAAAVNTTVGNIEVILATI